MAAIPCESWGHSTKEAARRARIKRMMTEGKTIILSSPDELLPLITEAVRIALCEHPTNTSELPDKRLLAPKDVEREFGIPQRTLAYWRQESVGPAYTTFGRRIFYERDVLEAYIASGRIHTSESSK